MTGDSCFFGDRAAAAFRGTAADRFTLSVFNPVAPGISAKPRGLIPAPAR